MLGSALINTRLTPRCVAAGPALLSKKFVPLIAYCYSTAAQFIVSHSADLKVLQDCKQSVASKAFYEIDKKPVCGDCLGIEDDGDEDEEED